MKFFSDLQPGAPHMLPAELFFRSLAEMPPLERRALEVCKARGGRVLDVGAGAGSHALALAEMGAFAEAVDIAPDAVEVMKQRGVAARKCSLWDIADFQPFNTVLLLMNSVGSVGSMAKLIDFLKLVHERSGPMCSIVLDVSPPDWPAVRIAARRRTEPLLASNFEEGAWAVLSCWLSFSDTEGKPFSLLFCEPKALRTAAEIAGWATVELVAGTAAAPASLFRLDKVLPKEPVERVAGNGKKPAGK